MTTANYYFPVDPAISHNAVFYNISGEVIWFLTKHTSPWYMDVHYGACSRLNPCLCCLSRKKRMKHTPRIKTCQFCKTAWRLSAVSYGMSLCVAASGRNVPRWRVIYRQRMREMAQSLRHLMYCWKWYSSICSDTGEAEFQCGVSGYKPHCYYGPGFSSDWDWHGSQSSLSAQDWEKWHEWQKSCESSYSAPRLYWHALDCRTPGPFMG